MPPGPTTSTSRSRAQQLGQGGDLLVAPDELGRQRRQVPRRRGTVGSWRAGSWLRTCRSSSVSRGPGSRPSSSASRAPDPLVGRQRVGLAARAVQRGDQQLPQPLLVGVRRDGGLELADRRVPEPQPRREPGLDAARTRASSSRARCGAAQSPAAGSTSPRKQRQRRRAQLARRRARRRRRAAAPRRRRRAARAARRRRPARPRAGSRRRRRRSAPDRPSARRSLATFDWSVLRRVAAPAHRSSSEPVGAHGHAGLEREAHQQLRRSCRPAPAASRPSRLTSTGPSTEISNTARVYGACQRACQRRVSAALDGRRMSPAHPGNCSAGSWWATTRRSPRSSRRRAPATTR